jgi:hypothetical protein
MNRDTADKFVCYADSTFLALDYDPAGGEDIGLRVKAPAGSQGVAAFGNVAVHGANAYVLNMASELEAPLVEDAFNHLNLDGTPYMWSLLWDWDMALDTVGSHGKYLRGTYVYDEDNPLKPEAWRGEEGWSDYRVLAEVRLDTNDAEANVYFRQSYRKDYFPGFEHYSCVLSYDGVHGALRLVKHWLQPFPNGWTRTTLSSSSPLSDFNPQVWHSVAITVKDLDPSTSFRNEIECDLYLNGQLLPQGHLYFLDDGTDPYKGYVLRGGRVGLAVGKRQGSDTGNQSASFDNVVVLEE